MPRQSSFESFCGQRKNAQAVAVRIKGNKGVAEIQLGRRLRHNQPAAYPFGMHGANGIVVGDRESELGPAAGGRGGRFYRVFGPQSIMAPCAWREAISR